jgi:hypothetical protein
MKVCAIVLNYRNARLTQACLASLAGQGLDSVVVVDNSEDGEYAEELASALHPLRETGTDYVLHVLTPSRNLGFAQGVNFALATPQAKACDAFLLLNNDAAATPGMVARLADRMTPEMPVSPAVVGADGKPQPRLWYHRYLGLLTQKRWPGSFSFPNGCCVMFGTRQLREGKLFDEDFFMYGEDILWGWQLARRGIAPCTVEAAVVRHEGGASSRKYDLFYEYHLARMHVLLAKKTVRHPLELPVLMAAKGAMLLTRALVRSLRSRSLVPAWAFVLAWKPCNVRPEHGRRAH